MYISNFNEYIAQVDWNKSSLVTGFYKRLKDEILGSIAIAEIWPQGLKDWMAMASWIDERLWACRQAQKPQALYSNPPSLSYLN